jgi:hypothetical protein
MKQRKPATVVELLVAARELIGVREHWCMDSLALTKLGRRTAPKSRAAVSWCAIGALHKIAGARETYEREEAKQLLDDEADLLAGVPMIVINDEGNYTRVLRLYDLAIAQARELEAQS